MLRTVQLVDGVPILSVNVGLLGLPDRGGAPAARPTPSSAGLAGDFRIEGRMMLEISVERAGRARPERYRALNEAVIEKRESGHTVRLLVSIDGVPFTATPPTA